MFIRDRAFSFTKLGDIRSFVHRVEAATTADPTRKAKIKFLNFLLLLSRNNIVINSIRARTIPSSFVKLSKPMNIPVRKENSREWPLMALIKQMVEARK